MFYSWENLTSSVRTPVFPCGGALEICRASSSGSQRSPRTSPSQPYPHVVVRVPHLSRLFPSSFFSCVPFYLCRSSPTTSPHHLLPPRINLCLSSTPRCHHRCAKKAPKMMPPSSIRWKNGGFGMCMILSLGYPILI